MMEMDSGLLMASMLFGLIGMGMLMYGKRSGRLVPIAAGVGMMAIPCFLPNLIAQCIVCTALAASPWVIRDA